jgi:hypothetical protein
VARCSIESIHRGRDETPRSITNPIENRGIGRLDCVTFAAFGSRSRFHFTGPLGDRVRQKGAPCRCARNLVALTVDAGPTNHQKSPVGGIDTGTDSRSSCPCRRRQPDIAGKSDSCNPTGRHRRNRVRTMGRNIATTCGPGPTPCRLTSEQGLPSGRDALSFPFSVGALRRIRAARGHRTFFFLV